MLSFSTKKRKEQLQTPKHTKKRGNTTNVRKKRAKKQNLKEKKIIKTFVERKIALNESITDDEVLELAHCLGRKRELVMVWLNKIQKNSENEILPQLFSEKLQIRGTKSNYMKGCGFSCERDEGDYQILCPRCRRFKFHSVCIQKQFERMGVPPPRNYMHENWACPHCLMKEKIEIVHTFV